MLDAIEEVHNKGYIHRDIKPVTINEFIIFLIGKLLFGKGFIEESSIHRWFWAISPAYEQRYTLSQDIL